MSVLFSNNSATNCSGQDCQQNQPSGQSHQLVEMVFIWIIIIVGIMGNSLVITVVKVIRSMRTTTNYLLVNVAVADITTLFFTAIHVIISRFRSFSSQALLSFLCKFIYTNNIVMVTLLVTSLTMTLLAFERYHALVKPMSTSRRLTNGNVAYVITSIWLVAIAMVTPLFASFDYNSAMGSCSLGDADTTEMVIYIDCLFVILTLIPFTVIAFCYSQIIYGMYFKNTICHNKSERSATREETREKRRLVTLLILLTVMFFIAFIPYGILLILNFNKISNANILYLQSSTGRTVPYTPELFGKSFHLRVSKF
ncbi:hypothetical protein OS493_000608 [Desmophyllum pertusum]|uniref:G-protein coupled receptors family 1 profile domain-containing protein n=1 Tax=Desmophyllum pertusum TaxID=174260 RepID=A0A9X0A8K5_9CNID|nr:hypothetical protein OS493_000608 [Desmophyllum pertusum]